MSADTPTLLDRQFLTMRAKLLELAADWDRLERAGELAGDDSRLDQLRDAVRVLLEESRPRAEKVQTIFSRRYDPSWRSTMNI